MSDKGKKTSFDIDCQISALDYLFFLLDCHFLEMQFIIQVEEIQSILCSLSLINCIFSPCTIDTQRMPAGKYYIGNTQTVQKEPD